MCGKGKNERLVFAMRWRIKFLITITLSVCWVTSFHAKFVPTDHNMTTQNKITMETAVLENKKRPRSISFSGLNANVVKLWQQLILRQAVILFSLERFFFLSKVHWHCNPSYSFVMDTSWMCHECQRRKNLIYQKYLIISIFRYGEQF